MYRETYRMPIFPICTQAFPSSIGDVPSLLPPEVLARRPGRPKANRIGKTRKRKRDRDSDRVRTKGYGHHKGKKVSAYDEVLDSSLSFGSVGSNEQNMACASVSDAVTGGEV
ncbi:hypothetical protein ACHQM5_009919 [Ranunculus cassubicifolius]